MRQGWDTYNADATERGRAGFAPPEVFNTAPIFLTRTDPYERFRIGDGEGSCMVHNPGYDFNDEILPIGASYWATLVEQQLGRQAMPQAAE